MNTENFKFSKEHEWVNIQDGKAYIGISDFAQNSLGDIVFVDLPSIGTSVESGCVFASVESVKAASDIFAPVSGKIVEINDTLNDKPELLNDSPFESWLVAVEISVPEETDALMNLEEYEKFCAEC